MPENYLHNEQQLLLRIAEGDQDAFTHVFNHYQGKLFTAGIALTHSEEVAEELVQDVFVKIWLKRAELIQIQSFSSYLFVMMRNEAYEWLNKQARRRKLLAKIPDSNPLKQTFTEEFLGKKETADFIQQAIHDLPPQQQEVFRLMREQGLSREQTAQALKIDINTVKTHMSRALKTLRAKWTAYGGLSLVLSLSILKIFLNEVTLFISSYNLY